ncbi:MAG: hypothetical protein AMXMBFR33_42460 [Candidatus Xenobia bacterium]
MMLTARERRRFTTEEYLWLEERSETKSEYLDGEIFALTGGSLAHAQIASNLIRELGLALKGTTCRVLGSDMRVYVQRSKLFTYPDVTVVRGPAVLLPGRKDTLCDARVIVEVLSPSTESYDRGEKFRLYQKLPSLKEYVLVPQDSRAIECWRRQGPRKWTAGEAPFSSLEIEVPVEALYDGVS